MFAKVATLLLTLGLVGCTLLALRQARLQAASELAQAQLRIQRADERLYELRSQVAARVTPREVEVLAKASGDLRPATNEVPPAIAMLQQPTPAAATRAAQQTTPKAPAAKPTAPKKSAPQLAKTERF